MNLNELNNKQYLLDLSTDKEKLDTVINKSRGYVLRLMEGFGIKPNLELLLSEGVNIYSLNFIIKNYELTDKEKFSLKKYFKDDTFFPQAVTNLNSQEIEEYILKLKELPKGTIIPFDLFSKHIDNINKMQGDADNAYIDDIVKNSVRKFSLREFISLDYNYLYKNVYLFDKVTNFFGNGSFQELYKNIMFNRAKTDKGLYSINSFKNFHFNENEGDFLRELLAAENHYSLRDYNKMSNIVGFSKLISKVEYFEKYNNASLESFSLDETIENKKLIQSVFLKDLRNLDVLINKKCTFLQFKEIVDYDFVERVIKTDSVYLYQHHHEETDSQKERAIHLRDIFLDYLINNFDSPENMKNIDVSMAVREIFDVLSGDVIGSESYEVNANKFLNKHFVDLFKSENVDDFIMTGSGYGLVNKYSIQFYNRVALEKPSINLLYVLLEYVEKNKDSCTYPIKEGVKNIKIIINDLVPKLDKDSVKLVAKYFNYKLPTSLFDKNIALNNEFQFNFLNYKNIPFNEIPERLQGLLFVMDKNFVGAVLKKRHELPRNVFYGLLRDTGNNKDILNFFIKYVDLHKDKLLDDKNIIRDILQSPNGNKIIKINASKIDEENYKEFLENVKIIRTKEKLKELNNNIKLSEKEDEEYTRVNSVCHKLSKEISWEFMDKKIDDLIFKKEFAEIELIKKNGVYSGHHDKFINYVNHLSYDNLLLNIDDKSFIKLLLSEVGYNGKTEIVFSKFNERENAILAELLFPHFKDKDHVFGMFGKDNLSFVNECAVKNTPLDMFYGYNFTPAKNPNHGKSYVSEYFTPEQVFSAYKNLEKGVGFFSEMNVNASFYHFISDNFKENESGFLKLLEMAKSDPKFYTILAHDDIFNNFAKDDSGLRKNQMQRSMEYFKSHFDLDILLSGMKIVLDEIKEFGQRDWDSEITYNKKVADSVIDRVIYNTYYDKTDYVTNGTYDTKYYSDFSKEDSSKIVDFLFKEAPLYLMGRHVIGCIENLSSHIGTNIKSYVKDDMNIVDHLVFPPEITKPEYFGLGQNSGGNRYNGYVDNIVNGLINYCASIEDSTSLDYLSFIIQQKNFMEKEIDYEYRFKNPERSYLEIVSYLSEDESFMEKLSICENHMFLNKVLKNNLAPAKKKNKI